MDAYFFKLSNLNLFQFCRKYHAMLIKFYILLLIMWAWIIIYCECLKSRIQIFKKIIIIKTLQWNNGSMFVN